MHDWMYILNVVLVAAFFLVIGYFFLFRTTWQLWQERKKDRELRVRFRNVLGFDLARQGEEGHTACAQHLNQMLANYRELLRGAKSDTRRLRTTHRRTSEGFVGAEVQAAVRREDDLARNALAIENLASEAGIVVDKPAAPGVGGN